jgi:subfamily B ATP-binding cassette protein MsbA
MRILEEAPLHLVLSYLRPYRAAFAASLVLGVLGSALDAFGILLLIPFLRSLFDMGAVLPGGGRNSAERLIETLFGWIIGDSEGLAALRLVCLVVILVTIVKNVSLFGATALSIRVEESLIRDLRNAVQAHMQRLPLAFFGKDKTGQLIARVESDTREARLIPSVGSMYVRHVASILAHVAGLVVLSWRLSLLALVLIPIMIFALRPILGRLRSAWTRVFDYRGEVTSALQENLTGMRLVKASGTEDLEARRFATRSARFASASMKTNMVGHLASPVSETLASIVALALVWIGAGLTLGSNGLGPDQFLAFVTLALRAISPIKALSQLPPQFHQGIAAAARFKEILEEDPEPSGGGIEATGLESEIRFEGVTFSYGSDLPVLHDVDLVIERGEMVALVGQSGAGKSTLVDLIPRFADPSAGRILIDGTDIRDLTLASLRRLVGLVSQDTVVFHDTVSANIAYGEAGGLDDAVRAAARAAHADGFIEELPEGYGTVLGDRGTRLSGGQRQRIGIARAVLRDSPILILDEATSALDSESETHVQDALSELFRGRTVLIIAHRLSTVRAADRILVLEEGRLVQEGTHDELLARDGAYARLFARQLEQMTPTS